MRLPGDSAVESPPMMWEPQMTWFDPWVERSPGEGLGNPLQYSSLDNPMDQRTWQATVHRATQSWTQLKQLNIAHKLEKYLF